MIEVVQEGCLEIRREPVVQLSAVHFGGRTAHKVVCVECRHQVNPKKATWGPDGAICPACRDDS